MTSPNGIVGWLHNIPSVLEQDLVGLGDPTTDVLAHILAAIRDLRGDLNVTYQTVERVLVDKLGDTRKTVIDGLGEIQVRRSLRRSGWQHDDLLAVVIARVIDEPATLYDLESGELLPYPQIASNIVRRMRECVSFGAGKVTGLRDIGVDPSEFCVEEPDHATVQLPPREIV